MFYDEDSSNETETNVTATYELPRNIQEKTETLEVKFDDSEKEHVINVKFSKPPKTSCMDLLEPETSQSAPSDHRVVTLKQTQ